MDWSYIAGFFDGEGCVTYSRPRNNGVIYKQYPYLTFSNTNEKVLASIQEFLSSSGIRSKLNSFSRKHRSERGWKECYTLNIYDKHSVQECIYGMHPYLIVKALDAEWAMELLESVTGRQSLLPSF